MARDRDLPARTESTSVHARPGWSTRQRWLVGGAIGAVLGLLATAVVVRLDGGSTARRTSAAEPDVAVVEPGRAVDPRALWVFGYDTLRVDPDTFTGATRLDRAMFGRVYATGHTVYFYEPRTGEFAALDARTNEVHPYRALAGHDLTQPNTRLAATAHMLAVLTAPDTVTLVTRSAPDRRTAVELGSATVWARVAATNGRFVVMTQDREANTRLWSLDERGRLVPRRTLSPAEVATAGSLRDLVTEGSTVWVVGTRGAVALRSADLAPLGSARLPDGSGNVPDAVATDGRVWVFAANGDAVAGLAADGTVVRVTIRTPALDQYRQPVSLVAAPGRVWALAPSSTKTGDRASQITVIDAAGGRTVDRIRVPSTLFAGAIAVTGR